MLDIKVIRENLDWAKEKLATRGIKPEQLDELVAIDAKRREAMVQCEKLKAERNEVSKKIAAAKREKADVSEGIGQGSWRIAGKARIHPAPFAKLPG